MLQKYNKWNVLKAFFDNPLPEGGFQLREISRTAGLAPTSVRQYLKELAKEGLIIEEKQRIHKYPVYYANRESEDFRFFKKIGMLLSLRDSGLLEYLESACMPDAILLFGSAARGEDTKNSDVDLFLMCKERKLDVQKFEKKINRRLSLFFSEDFDKLSGELKNNIINGIILKGYLKVF